MELVLFEKIDIQGPRSKDLAYLREEICVFNFAVRVDVDDGDLVLYGYGSWALRMGLEFGCGGRSDEGAGTLRCDDVLDPDWN